MTIDPLSVHARGLWAELARAPVSFGPVGSVRVAVSPESGVCPAGWVGAVLLGGSAIVVAPSRAVGAAVGEALRGVAADAVVEVETVAGLLPVMAVLGPATLGYVAESGFRAAASAAPVERLAVGHPEVRRLEELAGGEDADEAGMDEITSPAFVVRVAGEVVAASGYRLWPRQTAQLSVLTAPGWRGRGFGRAAASCAVADALAAGLVPQWRARPAASRRVAAALGFRELGGQLSFKLA